MSFFAESQPEPVEINGRALHCQICGHGAFWRREAQLTPALGSLLNFGKRASSTAVCFVCTSCGYIHWFSPQ